jgi:hypothetical protein
MWRKFDGFSIYFRMVGESPWRHSIEDRQTCENAQTLMHIFDHTIKPILLYGSEICGTFNPSTIMWLFGGAIHWFQILPQRASRQ